MSNNGPSNGRDGKGRFTVGNAGGPGNPYATQVAERRRQLLEAVTEDDWREIVRRLIEDAKAGDKAARAELFDRVLGKAHQTQSAAIATTVAASATDESATDELLRLLRVGETTIESAQASNEDNLAN